MASGGGSERSQYSSSRDASTVCRAGALAAVVAREVHFCRDALDDARVAPDRRGTRVDVHGELGGRVAVVHGWVQHLLTPHDASCIVITQS